MASSQDPVIGTEHVWIQDVCLYKKTRYAHLNALMLTSHRCMVSYVMFPFKSQNVYTKPGPCFRKHRFHWQKTWKPNCKRGFTSDKHQRDFPLEPHSFSTILAFNILQSYQQRWHKFWTISIQFQFHSALTLQVSFEACKRHCNGCEIVLGFFFWAGLGIFFGFLGWYHLPSVCNGLELEFVILHGICHIWACSPSILHGMYYMWACSPSILYGICHILACSPSILHGISYMWACSPSILYGICHILACSPSILHGMFYMWACSPKYLQMRKLGIRLREGASYLSS